MKTERRLSDLLNGFARTLVTDFPIRSILDQLVVRIVELLPIGSVGVTLISPAGEPRHITASDGSARRFVRLQTEMSEGPCMAAYSTGEPVAVPDLRDDDRSPNFARRGLEEGLRAVFSFPLIHEDHRLGVSVHQLMAPDFASSVAKVLADTDTRYMTLEVTESVLVADEERALSVIKGLKRLGVMVALDDFGTGQSSLTHLKQFPVDIVKIERSFIDDIRNNSPSRLIVETVVDLAHGLGMSVVAEGVETIRQRDEVFSLDCDFSQGFFFGRPESADDFNAILADRYTLPWPNPLLERSAWPNPFDSHGRRHESDPESALSGSTASSELQRWRRRHL